MFSVCFHSRPLARIRSKSACVSWLWALWRQGVGAGAAAGCVLTSLARCILDVFNVILDLGSLGALLFAHMFL